jgi:hypothetical protein
VCMTEAGHPASATPKQELLPWRESYLQVKSVELDLDIRREKFRSPARLRRSIEAIFAQPLETASLVEHGFDSLLKCAHAPRLDATHLGVEFALMGLSQQ